MRRNIDVYIGTEKLDVFDFEDINVENKLKDIRSVDKVFAPFSKEFSIPASATNNRIIKHYYNLENLTPFDARVRVDGSIKMDGFDYLDGVFTLMDSTLKNEQPYSYKLVFYGKTVSLKDLFGDDTLENLRTTTKLQKYAVQYDDVSVINGFKYGYNETGSGLAVNNSGSDAGDFCFPFIAGKDYHFWDSNAGGGNPTNGSSQSRNLNPSATTSPRGLSPQELKPAIRIHRLIEAIEEKYGFTFSNDFFNESRDHYFNTYLWLQRESGLLKDQIDQQSSEDIFFSDFSFTNSSSSINLIGTIYGGSSYNLDAQTDNVAGSFTANPNTHYNMGRYVFTVTVIPNTSGIYTAKMYDQNDSLIAQVTGSGSKTLSGTCDNLYAGDSVKPYIKIFSAGAVASVTLTNIYVRHHWYDFIPFYQAGFGGSDWYYIQSNYSNSAPITVSDSVNVATQMPDMKIIDFLKSLFNTFNLTAIYDGEELVVKTLDDYFLSGRNIDITQYVDTSKKTVAKSTLYSEIALKYKDTKTFAKDKSDEITLDDFGNEKVDYNLLNSPLAFDGGKYSVDSKFSHMMYERQTDQSDETFLTDIQWGWAVTPEENPTKVSNLLLYCVKEQSIAQSINMSLTNGTYQATSTYIRPSNKFGEQGISLNFGSEFDEWDREISTGSLFNTFYKNYIYNIYDIRSRLIKLSGHLPVSEIINLKPNDRLRIRDSYFRINKLDLNLNTGKVDFELIHDLYFDNEVQLPEISSEFIDTSTTSYDLVINSTYPYSYLTSVEILQDTTPITTIKMPCDGREVVIPFTGLTPSTCQNYEFKISVSDYQFSVDKTHCVR